MKQVSALNQPANSPSNDSLREINAKSNNSSHTSPENERWMAKFKLWMAAQDAGERDFTVGFDKNRQPAAGRKVSLLLVFCAIIVGSYRSMAATIYSTNFGTAAATTSACSGNFNTAGWTFTGVNLNVSTGSSSSGYTGVSGSANLSDGAASGSNFVNFACSTLTVATTSTSTATVLVNTTNYTGINVSFGLRRSSSSYTATVTLAWSTDGVNYTNIAFTEPAAASWGLATGSGLTLPSGAENQANLYIQWKMVRANTSGNYKIDDVAITGTCNNVTPSVSVAAGPGSTICAGTNVTFSATPTNGGTTPSYQWKLNGGNVGTNSPTYSNSGLANGNTVQCVLTSNANCASPTTATSNTVTMTVNANVTPSVAITANPGSTICAGTNVTFSAAPVNGGASPSYQWTLNSGNVGTNGPSYSNNSLNNGDQVQCVMTSNGSCITTSTAGSNTITITISSSVVPTISVGSNQGTSVCVGTNVTFSSSITHGGSLPVYQWMLNGGNVGTNSATYSNNTLNNNDSVQCVLTSNDGCVSTDTATSNTLAMTVMPTVTPAVSITINTSTTICSGTSVTFSAIPVNGGAAPTYQWKINGSDVGNSNAHLTKSSLANGDSISCVMTSNATCPSPDTAVSNSFTMTVYALPTISVTPPYDTIYQSQSVTLNASGAITYVWSPTSSLSSSAGTSVIAGPSASTTYTATGTDDNGCVNSTTVAITVVKRLIHYWDFNNSTPCGGAGLVNQSPVVADFSTIGGAHLVYDNSQTTPASCGCTTRDSILDNVGGSTINVRSGYTAAPCSTGVNNGVRCRNPSNNMNFLWYLPTTGYKNLLLTYATETSSAAGGQKEQVFSYSLDGGVTFSQANLPVDSILMTGNLTYTQVQLDLSAITGAINNPSFVFRITFDGQNTGSTGNNRFDNITLEGDTLICSLAANSNATNSCSNASNGSVSVTTSGGNGPYSYLWSNGATNSAINGLAPNTYTVTVTDANRCSAVSSNTVQAISTPTPSISGNTPFCQGDSITLSTGSFVSYIWSPGGKTTQSVNVNTTGTYSVTVTNANGCNGTASATVTVNTCPTILNLTLFLQGYYMGGGLMQPVLANENVNGATGSETDTIRVELHNAVSPYSLTESSNTILMVNGTATAAFSHQITGHSYWIAVRHRNTIQTWSAAPVAFSAATVYDFSFTNTQAYGANEVQVDDSPNIYAMYTGDINVIGNNYTVFNISNQDGNIDLVDFPPLDYGINNGLFGYYASDLNGDGNVDLLDFPVLDENINLGVFERRP